MFASKAEERRVRNSVNARLEQAADSIEFIARLLSIDDPDRKVLFAKAWDIKQIARKGTASAGV